MGYVFWVAILILTSFFFGVMVSNFWLNFDKNKNKLKNDLKLIVYTKNKRYYVVNHLNKKFYELGTSKEVTDIIYYRVFLEVTEDFETIDETLTSEA